MRFYISTDNDFNVQPKKEIQKNCSSVALKIHDFSQLQF